MRTLDDNTLVAHSKVLLVASLEMLCLPDLVPRRLPAKDGAVFTTALSPRYCLQRLYTPSQVVTIARSLGRLQSDHGLAIDPEDNVKLNLNFGLVDVVYEWARGVPFCEITQVFKWYRMTNCASFCRGAVLRSPLSTQRASLNVCVHVALLDYVLGSRRVRPLASLLSCCIAPLNASLVTEFVKAVF